MSLLGESGKWSTEIFLNCAIRYNFDFLFFFINIHFYMYTRNNNIKVTRMQGVPKYATPSPPQKKKIVPGVSW